MSSPQTEAALDAAATSRRLASQAYGIAMPALSTEFGAVNAALSQGEPAYLQQAYTGTRGAIREGSAQEGTSALKSSLAAGKAAGLGGNLGATMSPESLGSAMAGALYGPRVQEAAGQLGQMDKLFGFGLGQAQQTGSGALAATENQLRDIGMMQPYNSTYAGILGALNLGGSIYGGFGQRTPSTGLGGLPASGIPGTGPFGYDPWNTGGLSGIPNT